MARKITLETLAEQLAKMDARIEKIDERIELGFGVVVGDISKLATKDQIITLHGQVNSVETQPRGMQHVKLQARVADLEEEIFGKARG